MKRNLIKSLKSVGKFFSLFFFVHISTNLNTERYTPIATNMTLTDKERYVLKAILDNVLLDKDYFLTNGIPRGVRTDTEAFGAVNRLYKLMRPIKK